MSAPNVRYHKDGAVALVTLDRPEKLNAMSFAMIDGLLDAIERADADDEVRAVIFSGAGERAFCAGTDLTPEAGNSFSADGEGETPRDVGGRLNLRLLGSKKVLIAACNGVAVGIGATMQLPMDYRIAADDARFAFPFVRRGITPDGAASWFLPRIVGLPTAADWLLSGRTFGADEALARGLVRSLHPRAELMDAARAIADDIAANTSGVSVATTRAMLWRFSGDAHPMAGHRVESSAIYELGRGPEGAEGVASFLEKRAPRFPGKVSRDMPAAYPWWDEPDF